MQPLIISNEQLATKITIAVATWTPQQLLIDENGLKEDGCQTKTIEWLTKWITVSEEGLRVLKCSVKVLSILNKLV